MWKQFSEIIWLAWNYKNQSSRPNFSKLFSSHTSSPGSTLIGDQLRTKPLSLPHELSSEKCPRLSTLIISLWANKWLKAWAEQTLSRYWHPKLYLNRKLVQSFNMEMKITWKFRNYGTTQRKPWWKHGTGSSCKCHTTIYEMLLNQIEALCQHPDFCWLQDF